jgi:prepilin-type N-terminal cleavage/methylation domain-containing protein
MSARALDRFPARSPTRVRRRRRAFSLLEITVVVSISAVVAGVALAAVSTSVRRSAAATAFERFHLDLLALRKRARDTQVILRLCAAPLCARATPLGVDGNALIVEEVSACSPATPFAPPRFTTLRYGNDAVAIPDGSADGVCLFPDGHLTGFNGASLVGVWNGITLTTPPFSTRIEMDPASGAILGATGPFSPLPFVDNLADRSLHGAPVP